MIFNTSLKIILLNTFLLIWISPVICQKQELSKSLEVITPQKLKTHIDYLASDALLGRNTPSPGLDSAATYIEKKFKAYGLLPANGSYYQPVPLVKTSLGAENKVELSKDGVNTTLAIKTQFVPYDITANGEVSGSLVFAGYGITAPEYNYDDYSGLDVKGK
ncbi:MAG: hypothetical protein HC830_13435 [Bacteroidetes bacterium]|nr:hypothetical protein [Bacteroidota bacterium]